MLLLRTEMTPMHFASNLLLERETVLPEETALQNGDDLPVEAGTHATCWASLRQMGD